MQLMAQCKSNKKTMHFTYHLVKRAEYLEKLEPNLARTVFKTRGQMFDIKVNYKNKYSNDLSCPFRKMETETFHHLFECISGLYCPSSLRNIQFSNFFNEVSLENVRGIAKYFNVLKIKGRYTIRYLSLAFGRSELATVWSDQINSTNS